MDEQIFLVAPGVRVSSTRIELGGQTFATRNVGSVKVVKKGASTAAILLALVGLILLFTSYTILGACLFVGSAIWIWQGITDVSLVLLAGGGEVVAMRTHDLKSLESIRDAIASAISVR